MDTRLYDNIRKRRKELGLTQSQLAARMHYADKSMIAKIEKGIVDLPQSKIISFADALHTTPAWLMGWSSSENPHNNPSVKIPLCTGFENGNLVLSEDVYEISVNMDDSPSADCFIQMQDSKCGSFSVYICRQENLEDGIPFVFFYNNKFLLRQAYRYVNETLLLLRSRDPSKADIEISGSARKNLYVIGKVIAIKSNIL